MFQDGNNFHNLLGTSPIVLLTLEPSPLHTPAMARYSAFLGRAVDVQYRAGDICLPASGTFVADSGRSIFLEQHYEQLGQLKNFRWEIPYPCIVRLEEAEFPSRVLRPATPEPESGPEAPNAERLEANAANASAGASVFRLTRGNKPF